MTSKGYSSAATTENKVMQMIKNFCVFQNKSLLQTEDHPPLKPCVDRVFRTICFTSEEKEQSDTQIKNLRVKQTKLKRYLSKRFNPRLAMKLCMLFDWSKRELDYMDFYEQLDQIVLNNGISSLQPLEYDVHLISLK